MHRGIETSVGGGASVPVFNNLLVAADGRPADINRCSSSAFQTISTPGGNFASRSRISPRVTTIFPINVLLMKIEFSGGLISEFKDNPALSAQFQWVAPAHSLRGRTLVLHGSGFLVTVIKPRSSRRR